MRSCLFISASVGVHGWGGRLHGYLMRLCCLNRPVRGGGMGDTWLFNEAMLFLTAVEGGGGGYMVI